MLYCYIYLKSINTFYILTYNIKAVDTEIGDNTILLEYVITGENKWNFMM